MIRKSTINLNYSNSHKQMYLDALFQEYNRIVNVFVDKLWENQQFSGSFVKDTNTVESWLSARMKQAASKQALAIVKSQRKKKKKTKPEFNKRTMELDSRFVDIKFDLNSFDIWVKLTSIGNKLKLWLPSHKHKHFNNLVNDAWKLKKSIRLRQTEKGYFADLYFEKLPPKLKTNGKVLGIDIGYKKLIADSNNNFYGSDSEDIYSKISRKKQGSKAFKRALIERDEFINKTIKTLSLEDTKVLVIENLKNVKHKTKGRLRKTFVNKLQRWSYTKTINRIKCLCEELGVLPVFINPAYTSQTCSYCNTVDKSARVGEIYSCKVCHHVFDADYNAALNIRYKGLQELMVPV
jgi:putative transposase